MVRPALQPPTATNSGRKILPWPHQLTPASLAPASQQQKLQPLNPSLTTCPPSAQALPLTHLQPITPGANSGLMPLQPLSLTQLRSSPPSSCISQLGVPLSPQKMPIPAKGSRKVVGTMPQLTPGPPTPCTRVPLLPLSEATVKKSTTTSSMQATTASHVRKLLPRPLKASLRPTTNTVFQQQQQQGTLTALQQLHPVPPVSSQQTVSLQQFQSLNPSTTQATGLTLQTLNVSGQPPTHSGASQVVSLQHVRALSVPPPQSSQKVKSPEPLLQPPHHLHTVAPSKSPQRVTFQQVQQAPSISVSQGVAIHSLSPLAPSTQHQQTTTLCQVHTLQSSGSHAQGCRGTSLHTMPTLTSDSQNTVPVHQYPNHAPGDMQSVPQVSPVGSKSPLPQMCSPSFCTPHSGVSSQAEPQSNEQHTQTLHEVHSANHSLQEGTTLPPDTSHPAQGQDVVSVHVASRPTIATVGSRLPGGATSNGTVLKVPIQPLRPSASFPKVKRKYLRRSPRELKANKKKDTPILKLGSVTTYFSVQEKDLYTPTSTGAMQGRKILPRPCSASLLGAQVEHVHPVTKLSPLGQLVPQVRHHEGCGTIVTSLGSSSVGTLTHTFSSMCESQLPTLGLPRRTRPLAHSSSISLTTTDQGDSGKGNVGTTFLQPVSPAKGVGACTFVPHDNEVTTTPEGSTSAASQGVVPPGGRQLTHDKGTNDDDNLDQPSLECTESNSIDCPAESLLDWDDKAGWNQMDNSIATLKDDIDISGDSTILHSSVHNIHKQQISQDTSGNDLQDEPTLQDTTGDNTSQHILSDTFQDQHTLRDSIQDQHTLQNTSEDITQNHCTSQDSLIDSSIQVQPTSQDIPAHNIHSQPTSHYTTEVDSYFQLSTHNDPVDSTLDHPTTQDTLGDISQQSSTLSAMVAPLVIATSQGEEEDDSQEPQDALFEDNNFTLQPCSPVQDQDDCSPSLSPSSSCPPQSRFTETSSPTPAVHLDSSITQEQNTVCPFNESIPTSYLCQNNSWEPPSSLPLWPLPDMEESLNTTSTLPCTIPSVPSTMYLGLPASPKSSLKPPVPHTTPQEDKVEVVHTEQGSSPSDSGEHHFTCSSLPEIMMTRKDTPISPVPLLLQHSTDCSFPKMQDAMGAAGSSVSHSAEPLQGDFSVITATTTALATTTTTTTITVTTTTTAASTSTTTSQHTTTHPYWETEEKQESSNLSQENMAPTSSIVLASQLSEPGCPPTCISLEQQTYHKEKCQTPPQGQRKTWRSRQPQHRTRRGYRLKALVRAQRRTIQVLRHKLHCEQRRSRALWETLRRSMSSKATSGGEVSPKASGVANEEGREGITQPHPSPPVTRSRNRPKQVTAATLSTTRLKRKHEDKPVESLKKVVSVDHPDDQGVEVDNPHVQAIRIPTPSAAKTELQILVREFMMREDVSRPTPHGTRHCLHYLPLLHKRFMADCCQPCSLETFQHHLPPQVTQRVGEELETCVCVTCQNPELKVESLVRRRLLPLNTRLEEMAFSPEATFKEFVLSVQTLKARPPSQLSYSEWFLGVGGGTSTPLPQKRTLTRPLKEVVTLLERELELLHLHLTRAAHQYEATFRAKCEAEQSPQHAVLQAEWSPLIILHALGADGTPAVQQVVSLQCGYLWSHADSLGFIAVSGCRDQRPAAVCASLEPLLARLIQQGVRCLTLLVDPKTDLSAVMEYTRRTDLEMRCVFSEPGHGTGVAEAVGNSVTQLICDTVNSWGPDTVLSAKDVFTLICPNSSNLVYYYSEEDVWRSSQLLHDPAAPTKTANKLIKPKTLLSL